MTEMSPDDAQVSPLQPEAPEGTDNATNDAKTMSKKSVAISAAVGIGSAAIVAALLYTRRR